MTRGPKPKGCHEKDIKSPTKSSIGKNKHSQAKKIPSTAVKANYKKERKKKSRSWPIKGNRSSSGHRPLE